MRGRVDLYECLGSELCKLWNITEDMPGAEGGREDDELYKTVAPKIRELIAKFVPLASQDSSTAKPVELVKLSLELSYNVSDDPRFAIWKRRNTTARYSALAQTVQGETDTISFGKARQYVPDAVKQFLPLIEAQLRAADIIPEDDIEPEPAEDLQFLEDDAEDHDDQPTPELPREAAAEGTGVAVEEHPTADPDEAENLPEPHADRRKAWLAIGVAAVLVLGGVVYGVWPDSSSSNPNQSQSAPTFGTASCSDGSRNPIGSKLTLTVNSVGSLGSTSFVFPSSDTAQARDVVSQISAFGYPNIAKELTAGAYNYDNTMVKIKVDDAVPSGVTIYGLCVVNRQSVPTPSGILVIEPAPENGDSQAAALDLDAATPKSQYYVSGAFQGSFFDRPFVVWPQQGQELNLFLKASKASYTYQLALDYEVVGQRYTQMIPGTFRTAASLCSQADGSPYSDIYQATTDAGSQAFKAVSANVACS